MQSGVTVQNQPQLGGGVTAHIQVTAWGTLDCNQWTCCSFIVLCVCVCDVVCMCVMILSIHRYCSPEHDFPEQSEAISFVVRKTQEALRQNPWTLIVSGTYTVGKEKVFLGMWCVPCGGLCISVCCVCVCRCVCVGVCGLLLNGYLLEPGTVPHHLDACYII